MSLLVLSAQDVNAVISTLRPNELELLMASVFRSLSSRSGHASPHRTSIHMPQHTALFMPSRLDRIGTAIKVVSVPTSPVDMRGLPASTVLLDEETGRARAIVNASTLTALRNAAGEYHPEPLQHTARQCWTLCIHRLCPSNTPPTFEATYVFGCIRRRKTDRGAYTPPYPRISLSQAMYHHQPDSERSSRQPLVCTSPISSLDHV